MVIVDYGHPGVLFIIGDRTCVRVHSVAGVGGHVGDGEALGDVHTQEVGPRQGGDELEGLGGETSDNALGTTDKHKFLSD